MSIRQLNHAVLRVTNLEQSLAFYRDVLGLALVARLPKSAHSEEMLFLRSPHESGNHHDIALIGGAVAVPGGMGTSTQPGLFHLAFEVGTLSELEEMHEKLKKVGAFKFSADQTAHLSVYANDPDGLTVEVLWREPNSAWSYEEEMSRAPLDFSASRKVWGGELKTGAAAS
ncbi:VOC family protein [Duganella sp. FT135W]|uniref:VOC family protein n=1 Tax=Duganella flavida TaxID=2692175 RepID=A0A6L8KLF8_9BURK|nr:VOC family protein [Duganella flavida]MYM26652.1 VOC family protein [Duganella flavida]